MGTYKFAILLAFGSTVADSGEWDKDDRLLAPAGKPHAIILTEALRGHVTDISAPWNEEDYAWEFICRSGSITVCTLVDSITDGEVLVTVFPVVILTWFRRREITTAVGLVADRIEALLRGDPRFTDVRRFTPQQYEAANRAGKA